jgi:hypothetical protein
VSDESASLVCRFAAAVAGFTGIGGFLQVRG